MSTVMVPDSGENVPLLMNCWFEMAIPLPSALVSATTLRDRLLLVPPYSAMPLARLGCTTVLLAMMLFASAVYRDHSAIASSPVLRMKLFFTTESVTLPLKFRPSAVMSRIRLFWIVSFVLFGPISHRPTF